MNLDVKELPHVIVGCCMEVHRALGPGLPVEAYCECLARELRMKELVFKRDKQLEIHYKGEKLESTLTLDFLIEDLILVTVLAVDELLPIHKQDVNNYLRMSRLEIGLLVNFNTEDLRHGIKRLIVSSEEPSMRYQ